MENKEDDCNKVENDRMMRENDLIRKTTLAGYIEDVLKKLGTTTTPRRSTGRESLPLTLPRTLMAVRMVRILLVKHHPSEGYECDTEI